MVKSADSNKSEDRIKYAIERSAEEAVKAISNAAGEAVKTIANAAGEARTVVATNATEAAKVVIAKANDGSSDHDFLLTFSSEVKTKLDNISVDIKDLKDGTATKIADHELRLNTLETNQTKTTVLLSVGIGIMSLLVSILIYHLFQK
jgi:hypothetical protein